jgi:AbrB family looped-hinge helix DNA binding protein
MLNLKMTVIGVQDMSTVVKTRIGAGGRVVIPAEFRNALGLSEGDEVLISCDGSEVRLSTVTERVRRVQRFIAERIPPGGLSIVDELIADRRAETTRE